MMPTPHRLSPPCLNRSAQKTLHRVLSNTVAKAIVTERKKNGLFKSWEDLQKRVDGIAEKELVKLQAEAVLDYASTSPSKPAKEPSLSNAPARHNKKRKKASSKHPAAQPASITDNRFASQTNELREPQQTNPAAPPSQAPQDYDSDEDAPEDYKRSKASHLKHFGSLSGFCRPKYFPSDDEILRQVGEALMHPRPRDPRSLLE